MKWEPGDVIALGAVALSGLTIVMTLLSKRWERQALDRRERRVEAVAALTDVHVLLVDAVPDRVAMFASMEQMADTVQKLHAFWVEVARKPVVAVSLGHHGEGARSLAGDLEIATGNALTSLAIFVDDIIKNRQMTDSRERAIEDNKRAVDILNKLSDQI